MTAYFKSRPLHRALTLLTLAIVPLIIVGIYAAMQAEFRDVQRLREAREVSTARRDLLADLLAMHADAETGVRGYVITADETFLEPYYSAIARRVALFDRVEGETGSDWETRLPVLRELSDAKLANAARNIADVREGRRRDAAERIAQGGGKRLMDNIRSEIRSLAEEESVRLAGLTADSARSRALLEGSVTAMLIGLALLLAIVTLVVSRSNRLRSEALERARELNERQDAMFDGAVDGMLLLDEEARILRMNPSISRMFGYRADELLGRHNLILMDRKFTLEESAAWIATVGAAGVHGAGRRQEFTGRRADGTTFETEVAMSRVAGGPNRRYVAAIRDISDRKRAEKMKTEFVSTVSHELRTPLTSVGGSLGLLAAGAVGPLEEKQRRLVEIARSNCERLIRLINDILDIEKIESGKMEFDLRRMQIAPLVHRTTAALAGFADQHSVTLKPVLPPWPQCIVGDPDKLEQLLTNLISNAIKHAPEGSEVEVFCVQDGGKLRVEVRDRGAGVPQEFRSRIFGKFAMADASDSRAKGGTGLGLAIAREIARRHGGEIGFDDREGGGTVFHLGLPLATEDEANPDSGDKTLPRILHLDDDQDTLSVVASAFAGKAVVISAHTLAEAHDLLQEHTIHAAVLDVGLAYESGLDIVADLRAIAKDMPIIVFTAIDEAHEAGEVDRIMIKSRSSIADLVDVTMRLFEQRRKAA